MNWIILVLFNLFPLQQECSQEEFFKFDSTSVIVNSDKKSVVEKRIAIANDWISAAQMVVDLSKDEEAKEVMNFFLENYVIGTIVDGQKVASVKKVVKTAKTFVFLPLIEEDEKNSAFDDYFKNPMGAAYLPENQILLLKPNEDKSKFFKGFSLLHEIFHARDFLENGFFADKISDETIGLLEVRVREFLGRVMYKIGGSVYEKIVLDEAEYIQKYLKENDLQLPSNDTLKFVPAWELILGPISSQQEKELWYEFAWEHAIFAVIDSLVPKKTALSYKSSYILQIYKGSGMMK